MSSIKLTADSGGGTFELKAPSSGSNARVLTVPDTADGTILTTTNPKAGNVIQVKQAVKLDSFSTTSTTAVDVTGLSVEITPTSTSSKILVMVSMAMGTDDANFTYGVLKRGSTQIGEADGASNRIRPTFMCYDSNEGQMHMESFTFLDSPNTTSATTYKMQVQCASAGNATVGKSFRDLDTTQFDPRCSSTLTVMEVAV